MCVGLCVHMHVCAAYVYVHVCMHECMFICMCMLYDIVSVYACVPMHVHAHMRMFIWCVYVYACVCILTVRLCMSVFGYVCWRTVGGDHGWPTGDLKPGLWEL